MTTNPRQHAALLFILGATATPTSAADFALAGVVRTPEGRPLAGATVSVRDTPLAARTDATGGFRLSVASRGARARGQPSRIREGRRAA